MPDEQPPAGQYQSNPAERLLAGARTAAEAVALLDALIHELEPDPLFDDERDVAALRAIRAVLTRFAE